MGDYSQRARRVSLGAAMLVMANFGFSSAQATVLVRADASYCCIASFSPQVSGVISAEVSAAYNNDVPGAPGVASASAYANSATGKLGGYASGNATGQAGTSASIDEFLFFAIAGASANTITPITFQFGHDGSLSVLANGQASSNFFAVVQGFQGEGGATYQHNPQLSASHGLFVAEAFNGWTSQSLSGDASDRSGTFVFGLKGAAPSIRLTMGLGTFVQRGTADFSQTATVGLVLPDHVTFTSSSGAFLSAAAPEPQTWAFLILGFGGVGATLRRRRGRSQISTFVDVSVS